MFTPTFNGAAEHSTGVKIDRSKTHGKEKVSKVFFALPGNIQLLDGTQKLHLVRGKRFPGIILVIQHILNGEKGNTREWLVYKQEWIGDRKHFSLELKNGVPDR
jgi:hypothetical protein